MLRKLFRTDPLVLFGIALSGALIFICVVALVGGFQSKQERMAFERSQIDEREILVKRVKITRTRPGLQVNYMIESESLKQYPERGIGEFELPVFTETSPDGRLRVVSAQKGTLIESENLFKLVGQVEVLEKDSPDQPARVSTRSQNLDIDLNLPE